MIELIRNCSHGSEIATYLVSKDGFGKHIIKVAATPTGIKNLRCEIEGWSWYQKIRYQQNHDSICRIMRDKNDYLKIQIEFIDGIKADYAKGLEKNADMVKKVFEHYCNIFPYHSNGLSPFHGDFSLDNVIFNSNGVYIIDWEHFNPGGAPWGFDALYLLFETLYFGMRNRKRPSRDEINVIADSIDFLNADNRLERKIIERPLKFTKSFINDNPGLWGEQLAAFPDKLPILAFTHDRITLIDDMIFSKLKSRKR